MRAMVFLTVYLTTADEKGMMVSFIQSNYMGFGSGIVIPDTGIRVQNRGCGFVLKS
jgi:gamma-glutamyltranspeptidase/glutathione hydrolase